MSAAAGKDTASATVAAVRKRTRRARKGAPRQAKIAPAFRSQEEEVTPEEMGPVAVEGASTEDVEDREEIPPEGEEWPG